MILKEIKYSPYEIKLTTPFSTACTKISNRKGILLKITDNEGITGWGDSAPLPGFSSETFEDSYSLIKNFSNKFQGTSLEENLNSIEHLSKDLPNLSSFRFAVEQALLNIILMRNPGTMKNLFGRSPKMGVSINALIGIKSLKDSTASAVGFKEQGFNTIKVKAGRENFNEDFECLSEIRNVIGPEVKLRVDINGLWSFEKGVKYLVKLEPLDIEFVEQPVNNTDSLLRLAAETSIPLGADESIRNFNDAIEIIRSGKIPFLVIKPMLAGGIISSLKVISAAEKKNLNVIISSSFESLVGRSMLTLLASLINTNYAHGLNTAQFIEEDVGPDPHQISEGIIYIDPHNYPPYFYPALRL